MRAIFVPLAAALALAGCHRTETSDGASVEKAWVRLPAVQGRPAAGYFTLNGGPTGTILIAASSPRVQRIELHDSMSSGGMMQMAPLPAVAIPARGTIEFKPGGKHAMLFGVDPAIKAGDTIDLRLTLKDQSSVQLSASAKVIGAGDPPPAD